MPVDPNKIPFVQRLVEIRNHLLSFLPNPVVGMRRIPSQWDWINILLLQAILTLFSGFLGGVIQAQFGAIILRVIFFPITSVLILCITTAFFYYTFYLFFRRKLNIKDLYLNILFASVPFVLSFAFTPLISAIALIGLLMTCLLLIVGLHENFKVPRKYLYKIIGGLFFAYAVMWTINTISFQESKKKYQLKHHQESLDILEKEMRGN